MTTKQGAALLAVAAAIAFCTALAHMSCIYFGPVCYTTQMAPESIVESAKANTLLAPVGALMASSVFVLLGCYALSGAKFIRRLPCLKMGIYTIAFICIVRGILPLQLWVRHPEKVSDLVLIVGLVWLAVGLCYLFGFRAINSKKV